MNLVLQLLPYVMFAAVAAASMAYYVTRESRQRTTRRRAMSVAPDVLGQSARPEQRFSTASRVAPAVVAAGSGKTQILRLRELGVAEGQIAAALQVPLQEVQIVLNLERIRRPSGASPMAPSEIAQPSIVE